MLEARNISVTLEKDLRTVITGLSFTLNRGDRCAVIGEEGNGKSTLLKLLHDEALISGYASYTGTIMKSGIRTAYLPQELSEYQKRLSINEFSKEYLLTPENQIDIRNRSRITAELGLPVDILESERIIGSLSGGEKVKLLLLLLRLSDPDVMLLDEPSNDIDIETLEILESFILSAEAPVIYISHDEKLLTNTANMIIHIEQLRDKSLPRSNVEHTDYRSYIEKRARAMANQSRIAGEEREAFAKKEERWRKIYDSVDYAQKTVSRQAPGAGRLLKKKMHTVKAMGRRLEKEKEELTDFPESEEAIIPDFINNTSFPAGKTVLNLYLPVLRTADGGKILAENIRLDLSGPRHIVITGKNGCGKTTLLRLIADQLKSRKDIKAAYMPQNYEEELDLSLTPVEILAPSGKKDDITRARSFLGAMKFTRDEMLRHSRDLSGGQKAKLYITGFLLGDYNVLILDEPTRNLSPLSGPEIRRLIKEYKGAVIAVSHDRMFIDEVGDSVFRLDADGLSEISSY